MAENVKRKGEKIMLENGESLESISTAQVSTGEK
jgi:hypothetical protein